MVRLPRNEKQTHRMNSRPQMWPSVLTLAMTLTLNFQGQMWNSLYLSQKWSDCHETKSEHIDWSQDLKCDHWVWPWTWPWPWIFKVKYWIGYISAKNGPIDEKQTHRLNSWPQKWPSDLTLAVTLMLDFQGEIWIFIYLNLNWPDCHETKSKHIDLNSRPQIWPMGLTLAMTLIFEFWRSYVILTIWWPRSGVRIYQIVTGVTSDVGVPSTHLVWITHIEIELDDRNRYHKINSI